MNNVTEHEVVAKSGGDRPENLTLRQIYDRDKAHALMNARKIVELIGDMKLNGWFGDFEATDANCPMASRRLAEELCDQLRHLERLKIIISDEGSGLWDKDEEL